MNSLTPLMYAAIDAADETLAFLLSKGASPDFMEIGNATALVIAIQSGCSSSIDLLAPVTTKGLEKAAMWLAAWHTKLTPAVEDLLRTAASDNDTKKKDWNMLRNLVLPGC